MTASSQHKGLEPGIYFGLPEDIYHADPAVSRSDIVNMLDTPNTYWKRSWMNPARESGIKSGEMVYGSAFHTMLFEPQHFEERFFVFPLDKFVHGKAMVTDGQYNELVNSIKVLRAGKDSSLFLSGGLPEVTIVFDDDGVRYRTRHDYFGIVVTTEFKTAVSLEEWHLKNEFRKRGLDIQMALYLRSRVRIREQIRAGTAHVYGKVKPGFFKQFMNEELNDFIFIFQRKTDPHPFLPLMPEQDTQDSGERKIESTRRIYKEYMRVYGPKTPWPVSEGKVKRFSMIYGIADER